jgi:hypothetical protein
MSSSVSLLTIPHLRFVLPCFLCVEGEQPKTDAIGTGKLAAINLVGVISGPQQWWRGTRSEKHGQSRGPAYEDASESGLPHARRVGLVISPALCER